MLRWSVGLGIVSPVLLLADAHVLANGILVKGWYFMKGCGTPSGPETTAEGPRSII